MPTIDDILRAQRRQSIFDRVAGGSSSSAPAPVPPSIFDRLNMATQEPLPMEGRLSFLPARVTPERGREWAVPGIAAGMWNAAIAPGRALSGQEIGPGEAFDFSGSMMTGGMPVARAGGPGELGLNVFHGSPHRFDKFDMSKIGTGEGAQAYGHGLYLAESPGVAQSYRFAGQPGYMNPNVQRIAQQALDEAGGDIAKARDILYPKYQAATDPAIQGPLRDAYNNIETFAQGKTGNLYKVDLPDEHIAKMLDWDKPLSQQPESVQKLFASVERLKDPYIRGKVTTGEALAELSGHLGGKPQAAQFLREQGIPGIRYLDQGSRTGGKGTSNFVVFDDQIPKILSRE